MMRLAASFNLPDVYKCTQGTTATGMEALMIMLRRFSYPNQLCDLIPLFGRSESELSLILSTVSYVPHRLLCFVVVVVFLCPGL